MAFTNQKNKLHKPIQNGCKKTTIHSAKSEQGKMTSSEVALRAEAVDNDTTDGIFKSNITEDRCKGYGFHSWQYVAAMACLQSDGTAEVVCLDTGCTMSIIDREFLQKQAPTAKI